MGQELVNRLTRLQAGGVYIYTNIDPKWDTVTGHMYTIVKITKVLIIKTFYEIIPTIMMKS